MEEKPTVLLVEDDPAQRKTLAGFLRKRGYAVLEAGSAAAAQSEAEASPVDLLLTDLKLGGPDGIELLRDLRARHPDLQALVVTAYGTVDDAVRAMKEGAYDFLSKPVDLDRLEALVEKALERVELSKDNRRLREVVKSSGVFAELIGESEAMRSVKDLALKVARSRASVLVLGESGTGKDVLARAIHRASPRQGGPFVSVNCGALPETLIESELFGHERGAFTGASAEKMGRFELAHGGTLFLDEVGDIPMPVQVKLLSVLQSRRFERVGGERTRDVDVRVIAATHRDLEERVEQGSFRSDLYYRLNVVSITMPALRDRPADIPQLVEHLLRKHSDLALARIECVDRDVLDELSRWPFPGNVRELENWIERAFVLAEGSTLTRNDFPPQLFDHIALEPPVGESPGGLEEQVRRLEMSLIRDSLGRNGGNQSAAGRELGLSERAIRYKIRKYDL